MCRPTVLVFGLAVCGLFTSAPRALGIFDPRSACLELVAAEADMVLLGRIKQFKVPEAYPAGSDPVLLTLQISESLKGANPGEMSLSLPRRRDYWVFNSILFKQLPIKEVLVFLGREVPADRSSVQSDCGLFVTDLILLLEDGSCRAAHDSQSDCWNLRLVQVQTRAEVLRTVRDALAFGAHSTPSKFIYLTSPTWLHDSPAQVPSRVRDMAVPTDRRLEQAAYEWLQADDVEVQSFGLQALAACGRSEKSIAALKAMLTHPYFKIEVVFLGKREWYDPQRWLHGPDIFETLHWYPLREKAYKVLNGWEVDVPPPTIQAVAESPPLPRAVWVVAILLSGALTAGLYLFRRRVLATR